MRYLEVDKINKNNPQSLVFGCRIEGEDVNTALDDVVFTELSPVDRQTSLRVQIVLKRDL